MQNKQTPEYAAKVQKTVDFMERLYRESCDKNTKINQTQKAEKLLSKFGKK